MKSKHTPGKWVVGNDNEIRAEHGGMIASAYMWNSGKESRIPGVRLDLSSEEVKANAKLIAAAPELLGALKKMQKYIVERNLGDPAEIIYKENEKVIAKSEEDK